MFEANKYVLGKGKVMRALCGLVKSMLLGYVALNTPLVHSTNYDDYDAFDWNRALIRGINVGNSLEVVEPDKWKIEFGEEYIQKIAEAGFTSIRIPVRWSVYSHPTSPYTIDPKALERVDKLIKLAFEHNLTVVINVHHFRALMESPNHHRERFLELWEQLSSHYSDYPPQLYFELLNEPSKQLWADIWNEMLLDALSVVRVHNPNRAVLIGPARFNSLDELERLQLPADDPNIIATFHYYKPLHFTHQGADWVYGYRNSWEGTTWTGSEEEKLAIQSHFEMATTWADRNQVPLNMGEFGVYWKADRNSRIAWTKFVRTEAEKREISWTYWSFGAGFGVYDTKTEHWRASLLNALIPQQGRGNSHRLDRGKVN